MEKGISDIKKYLKNHKEEIEIFSAETHIFVVRNYTIEPLETYLQYECAKWKIRAKMQYSNYEDQKESLLRVAEGTISCDAVLIDLLYEELIQKYRTKEAVYKFLEELFDVIEQIKGVSVVFTLFYPGAKLRDLYFRDYQFRFEIEEMNRYLREQKKTRVAHFVDVGNIQRRLGMENSVNLKFAHLFQAPHSEMILWEYAKNMASYFRYSIGNICKVIVLDGDNTLWGGIIGEDGIEKIQLDPHTYPGVCYYNFQFKLKKLLERGYLLALNSKNNLQDIEEIWAKHPYNILKREDFASIYVNWKDKASNMKSIAEELNLGMDSFLFVDDSATECQLIKGMHPEITVWQVHKPENLEIILYQLDFLQNPQLNNGTTDRKTEGYQNEKKRQAYQMKFSGMEEYLTSLEMKLRIEILTKEQLDRAEELCFKTNQFNTTTKRYTKENLSQMMEDPLYGIYTLFVEDRFGQYGQTGLLIVKREDSLQIDSFLMSCRVLGKNIENEFLKEVLRREWKKKSFSQIVVFYRRTKKNQQIEDFLKQMLFRRKEEDVEEIQYSITVQELDLTANPIYQVEEEEW